MLFVDLNCPIWIFESHFEQLALFQIIITRLFHLFFNNGHAFCRSKLPYLDF